MAHILTVVLLLSESVADACLLNEQKYQQCAKKAQSAQLPSSRRLGRKKPATANSDRHNRCALGIRTRPFAMDWMSLSRQMSLSKQSKQLVPTPHCSRPRLLPLRFQTQRQACGSCRVCLSVRRLQAPAQAFHLFCRPQSREQAPRRRQRALPVAATADEASQRQADVKVYSTDTNIASHAPSAKS